MQLIVCVGGNVVDIVLVGLIVLSGMLLIVFLSLCVNYYGSLFIVVMIMVFGLISGVMCLVSVGSVCVFSVIIMQFCMLSVVVLLLVCIGIDEIVFVLLIMCMLCVFSVLSVVLCVYVFMIMLVCDSVVVSRLLIVLMLIIVVCIDFEFVLFMMVFCFLEVDEYNV